MTDATTLDAVAGVLLPGDGRWPSAEALGVGARMLDLAAADPLRAAALEACSAVLTAVRAASDDTERTALVSELERSQPAPSAVLRMLAYQAYYEHAQVQQLIADRTGWRPGPAQPEGYPQVFELERPPDLRGVRARGVQWRPDGTATANQVRASQAAQPDRIWTEKEISAWRQ